VTPGAEPVAHASAFGGLRLRIARERALVSCFELAQRKSFRLRAAKLYAFGVFVSYAVAISVARGSGRSAAIQGFLHSALIALSWVVGALAALGTAHGLSEQPERDGLRALAVQRGFSSPAILRARTLAGALRIARLIAVPALALVGVAVARGQALAWALATLPAVLAYAAGLGLCLAALAHFSSQLSPRHARGLLVALVLGPLLISQAYSAVPSVPGLFAAWLDQLLGAGAAFT
jgi:hypothetical protein